jgi:hypothetical protein
MRRHSVQLRPAIAAATLAVVLGACAQRPAAAGPAAGPRVALDGELSRIRAAIETALTAPPPRGYAPIPQGVRLLSVARAGNGAYALDFNRTLLGAGTGRPLEDALHQILAAASSARAAGPDRRDDFRVLIDGAALETYLR